MHKDNKDMVSVLFPVEMEEGKGGQLEMGGTNRCFDWQVGDCVVVDSQHYTHGSRRFFGQKPRIVGIFIIHLEFLRLFGIDPNTLLNNF